MVVNLTFVKCLVTLDHDVRVDHHNFNVFILFLEIFVCVSQIFKDIKKNLTNVFKQYSSITNKCFDIIAFYYNNITQILIS